MNKQLDVCVLFLVGTAIVYSAGAFVAFDANPANWSMWMRVLIAVIWLVSAPTLTIVYVEKRNEQKKAEGAQKVKIKEQERLKEEYEYLKAMHSAMDGLYCRPTKAIDPDDVKEIKK